MPTLNPRITVTLTPAVAAVLKRMSVLTGNSQSALIGELLEESRPVFERMVLVLQAAKDVRGKVQADIAASMGDVQKRLEQQLGLGLDLMDVESVPLLEAAEKVNRRGPGAGKRSAAPGPRSGPTPISNRGVTPHGKTGKQQKRGARRGQV